MSVKADVAAQMVGKAQEIEEMALGWPHHGVSLTAPKDAVTEAAAILYDAATELTRPPKPAKASA